LCSSQNCLVTIRPSNLRMALQAGKYLYGDSLFPMQVGPPTQYARDKRPILCLILLVQTALIITHCVFSFDIIGALIMCVNVFVGFLSWQQEMNITYLCIYGIVCFLNGLFSLVMAFLVILVEIATVQIGAVISSCFLPMANFAGAYLAYLVWKDWQMKEKKQGIYATKSSWSSLAAPAAGLFGLGSMFSTAENAPLNSAQSTGSGSMFGGKGYTLGQAGDTDAFLTKAKAYSDQGYAQAQSGLNGASAQAQSGWGSAGDYVSNAQAGLFGSGKAVPQGHHDVTYDPFITK